MSSDRPIKMLDLPHLHAPIRDAMMEVIERVVDGGNYVLGEEVEAFERELADFTGARYAISCGSGSDALFLALQASGVGPGDEVICPAFSFFATAGAIARLGARPVFVDVEPASLNLDPEAARRAARGCQRLRALLPVDIFGQVARIDDFLALGNEVGVPVIEDAAQALGALDQRAAAAGTRARMGCLSFYPTKTLGALGEGGMILTNDPDLKSRLQSLRSHGQSALNRYTELGVNSRLDALKAAVLRVKLRVLPDWLRAQKEIAADYDALLAEAGAAPSDQPFGKTPLPLLYPSSPATPAESAHHQYTVRVLPDARGALRTGLARRGIETAIYYPVGLHQQPSLTKLGYTPFPLTNTEAATRQVISLPSHPGLDASTRRHVIDTVVEVLLSIQGS
ncbi:MAG: DegT/DnrJ/EryC1/StrS family aminotransferase [Myxococcota bacterium]